MKHKHDLSERDLKELNLNNTVCVYGAGRIGIEMSKRLQGVLGVKIDCFCDRDQKKWGKEILPSVKCVSPVELHELENVVCFVLIGQYYKESALNDLAQYKNIKWFTTFDDLIAMDSVIDGILEQDLCTEDRLIDSYIFNPKNINRIENKNGKRVALYTCITGGYEDVKQPKVVNDLIDYYCITDNSNIENGIYSFIDEKNVIPNEIIDNTRRNRFAKIMGPFLFEKYDYSIYVDGNVQIVGDVTEYLGKMNQYGLMSHMHVYEDCIYSEAVRVICNGKDDVDLVKSQMRRYKREGMPSHYGMLHNAILVRKNNIRICKTVMLDWWKEVSLGSKRDQLSLTYCLWKLGIKAEEIGTLGNNMRANPNFIWLNRHNK